MQTHGIKSSFLPITWFEARSLFLLAPTKAIVFVVFKIRRVTSSLFRHDPNMLLDIRVTANAKRQRINRKVVTLDCFVRLDDRLC